MPVCQLVFKCLHEQTQKTQHSVESYLPLSSIWPAHSPISFPFGKRRQIVSIFVTTDEPRDLISSYRLGMTRRGVVLWETKNKSQLSSILLKQCPVPVSIVPRPMSHVPCPMSLPMPAEWSHGICPVRYPLRYSQSSEHRSLLSCNCTIDPLAHQHSDYYPLVGSFVRASRPERIVNCRLNTRWVHLEDSS